MKGGRVVEQASLTDKHRLLEGPVSAAFEHAFIDTGGGEHGGGKARMRRLAIVRRTGERQFPVAEAVGIRGTAFDKRQALHGLAGRAREDAGLDIALRKRHLAIAVDHDHHAAMAAFDEIAAGDFDKDGVCHVNAFKYPVSGAVLSENLGPAHYFVCLHTRFRRRAA